MEIKEALMELQSIRDSLPTAGGDVCDDRLSALTREVHLLSWHVGELLRREHYREQLVETKKR